MASKQAKYTALREQRRRLEREAARRDDRELWIVYTGIAVAVVVGVASAVVAVVMFVDLFRGA